MQKSNCEEAVELLKMSLDACKQLPLSLVMFYDELSELMECHALHPTIVEWSADFKNPWLVYIVMIFIEVQIVISTYRELTFFNRVGKHVGDFESMFLSDLDGGKLTVKDLYCGLEGDYC